MAATARFFLDEDGFAFSDERPQLLQQTLETFLDLLDEVERTGEVLAWEGIWDMEAGSGRTLAALLFEPDDIDRLGGALRVRVNRELRGVNRRLDRLEYTQISPQEFSSVLDRIYEEIGRARSEMRAEFVAVNARLESLDAKIDIIIRRLSGEGNLEE